MTGPWVGTTEQRLQIGGWVSWKVKMGLEGQWGGPWACGDIHTIVIMLQKQQ